MCFLHEGNKAPARSEVHFEPELPDALPILNLHIRTLNNAKLRVKMRFGS
jgi:hypothetical protein